MTKTCPACNKEFNAKQASVVCCSRVCARRLDYLKGRGGTQKGLRHNRPRNPELWGEEKFCPGCGERFRAAAKVVHCSHACAARTAADRRGRVDPEERRRRLIARRYGLTLAQYDELWVKQKGRCAICDNEMTISGNGTRGAHVDHCHDTHRVRGMLCAQCNHGLGKFGDDPGFLEAAALYLTGYRRSDGTPPEAEDVPHCPTCTCGSMVT